jgi:hypothetical protein
MIEVPEILYTDSIGILTVNASGGFFHATSREDIAVRKDGEMLPDIRPSIGIDMVIFHGFLSFEVIIPIEQDITGDVGVMLLYGKDGT